MIYLRAMIECLCGWFMHVTRSLAGPVPLCENMTCSVLSVAICLFNTIYDICDTQENERRLDDKPEWVIL